MSYVVYIKDNIGNMIGAIDPDLPKQVTLPVLNINDGLLYAGNYKIPIGHILFIKEE